MSKVSFFVAPGFIQLDVLLGRGSSIGKAEYCDLQTPNGNSAKLGVICKLDQLV